MLLKKPIVGICHGAFLLTTLLGGTIEDCSYHMDTEHTVITNNGAYIVNSYHDYQITKLHTTGTAVAHDEDGNCEAWIDGTLAGIVWHPERMQVPFVPIEIANLLKI
jgi:gamma-glutamyl-gamma-aminobutyrate hydrolase PuuD